MTKPALKGFFSIHEAAAALKIDRRAYFYGILKAYGIRPRLAKPGEWPKRGQRPRLISSEDLGKIRERLKQAQS